MDTQDIAGFLENERSRRDLLEKEALAARKRLEAFEDITRILHALRTSWRAEDPGKYATYAFLVRTHAIREGNAGRPVLAWVDAFHALSLMDGYREPLMCRHPRARLDAAEQAACPDCGFLSPIVGTYDQTYDSPEGDCWEMRIHMLCIRCTRLDVLASATSPCRMSLRPPERRP